MRILVTGGAGFIGSHAVEALLADGRQVLVLDDLSSGKRANLPKGVPLEVLDIRSPEAAERVVAFGADAMVHLAAQMDVRRSVEDPLFDADVNVRGSLNLLEACRRAGTRRVIFASTGGAIYGEQEHFPAREDHPQRPVSPYGCAKSAVERYLGFYEVEYGFECLSLRFANVYGPRQDPHGEAGVVAIFCGRLLSGEPCTIFGDGAQTRDYVYVGDIARAIALAVGSEVSGALNLGTGMETDVVLLYRLLAAAAGSDAEPTFAPARPGEQQRSCVDPSLAGERLDWRPEIELPEGLRKTLESFRG
ncbi:MAG: NAD-dependent epimerase/dehydratase family protein [Deltaproteobacteria bacterium]|nr:NAD-dependent epimerase/dehydratase family protein [Deltaproteobacteria bacterium]